MKAILVTGSLGFIGNTLIEKLDRTEGIKTWSFDKKHGNDMCYEKGLQQFVNMSDQVYHLAANSSVAVGQQEGGFADFESLTATYNLLEAMRKSDMCKTLFFTSSSAVYGSGPFIYTEHHCPSPISLYAASKAACENLIRGYCNMFDDMKAVIFRLANIIGPYNNKKGVIYDLVQKLKKNPNELEILGDGLQNKPYVYIDDCVSALLSVKPVDKVVTYNVCSDDTITVNEIVDIITKEMGLQDVKKTYKPSWKGDVSNYMMDNRRLKEAAGWTLQHPSSKDAVRKTVREIYL